MISAYPKNVQHKIMYFSGNGSRPKQSTVILRRIGELMPIEIIHRISYVFSVNSGQERSSELMIRGWKAAKRRCRNFSKNIKNGLTDAKTYYIIALFLRNSSRTKEIFLDSSVGRARGC